MSNRVVGTGASYHRVRRRPPLAAGYNDAAARHNDNRGLVLLSAA
jgi:hypothetical protein